MNTVIDEFGLHAGKVWHTLSIWGPLKEDTLQKTTRLREENLRAAIGWLARENKIVKEGTTYKLGETNLTQTIGANAGKIWNTLSTQGECDISTIAKHTQIPEEDCYTALGWLAREDKILAKKMKAKDTKFKVALK